MKIRVGTVGTGSIVSMVCAGMQASGRFEITAVSSRSLSRAQEQAERSVQTKRIRPLMRCSRILIWI